MSALGGLLTAVALLSNERNKILFFSLKIDESGEKRGRREDLICLLFISTESTCHQFSKVC